MHPTQEERASLAACSITCLGPSFSKIVKHNLKHHGPGLNLLYIHRLANASSYTELVDYHAPTANLI